MSMFCFRYRFRGEMRSSFEVWHVEGVNLTKICTASLEVSNYYGHRGPLTFKARLLDSLIEFLIKVIKKNLTCFACSCKSFLVSLQGGNNSDS